MNEVNLTELGIKDSRDLLKRKQISATELTKAYIQNIEESSKLNAFIEKTFDKALMQASQADKIIGTESEKSLCGIQRQISWITSYHLMKAQLHRNFGTNRPLC